MRTTRTMEGSLRTTLRLLGFALLSGCVDLAIVSPGDGETVPAARELNVRVALRDRTHTELVLWFDDEPIAQDTTEADNDDAEADEPRFAVLTVGADLVTPGTHTVLVTGAKARGDQVTVTAEVEGDVEQTEAPPPE